MATKPPNADEYLTALEHPLKPVIEAVRKLILGVDPAIREGIKWNAPSYRTTADFATFHLRDGRVWLILHTGAKGKTGGVSVADPTGLVEWLDANRAVVKFADAKDVRSKKAALTVLLREWLGQLPAGS